jgi:Tfp pilus assembly protein FimV
MMRRSLGRRRTGLVGTMARTAVVAGTATAVAGSVAGHQQAKQDARAQSVAAQQAAFESQSQIAELQAQVSTMQTQQAQSALPAAPPAASTGADGNLMAQLQQLTEMKQAGFLSDVEFDAAKSRLLGL